MSGITDFRWLVLAGLCVHLGKEDLPRPGMGFIPNPIVWWKSVTWLLGVTQDYIWLYRMENTNKTGLNKVEVTFISPLVWWYMVTPCIRNTASSTLCLPQCVTSVLTVTSWSTVAPRAPAITSSFQAAARGSSLNSYWAVFSEVPHGAEEDLCQGPSSWRQACIFRSGNPPLYNSLPSEFGTVLPNSGPLVTTYDLIIKFSANVVAAKEFFQWHCYRFM